MLAAAVPLFTGIQRRSVLTGWPRKVTAATVDGAISEVATRRSEFAAILKSQGIAALNRKADILTATIPKAS